MPVSSSLVRLVAVCCVLAALAVMVPRVAPDVLAALLPGSAPAADVAASASATPGPRPPGGYEVVIPADPQGHFLADASVNGLTLRVVVDTGSTAVALTSETARRLGLHLSDADYRAQVSTANGVTAAAPVVLSEVRLGAITLDDVDAVVIPGDGLDVNLLGMSFLSRLTRFEIRGGQLILTD